jgi:hypothetical protein
VAADGFGRVARVWLRAGPLPSLLLLQLQLHIFIAGFIVEIEREAARVDLVSLIRFLVVELIYSGSNSRFDMSVVFTVNYFFNER